MPAIPSLSAHRARQKVPRLAGNLRRVATRLMRRDCFCGSAIRKRLPLPVEAVRGWV